MAKKTKNMLMVELNLLKNTIEELKNENRSLNIDKDYWFVQSERFKLLYQIERKDFCVPNYEQKLLDVEEMEKHIASILDNEKRYEMAKKLTDHYYGVQYLQDSL
jgi:hypothetical protein